jgi:uncharacterized protein (TIGR02246 family)
MATRTLRAAVGAALVLAGAAAIPRSQDPKPKAEPAKAAPAQQPEFVPLTDRPEDERAIRGLLTGLGRAYNDADAEGIGGVFDEDAVLYDADGAETRGRAAIVAQYKEGFSGGPTARIAGAIDSLRFLGPDTASLSGQFELLGDDDDVLAAGRYGALATRRDGKWRLAEVRDYSVAEAEPAAAAAQALGDLDWMVGEWVDESPEAKVTSTVRRAEGGRFLVREYTLHIAGAPATSGTQWIGYDPRSRQIQSWVFDSQGGHGEGLWVREGDGWLIKATGVLADGRATTATQHIEPINKDAVRLRSFDRTIGDEALPDTAEITLVRRPPAPAGPSRGEPAAEPAKSAR